MVRWGLPDCQCGLPRKWKTVSKPTDISCSNKMAAKALVNNSNDSDSSELQICDLLFDEDVSMPYTDDSPPISEWEHSSPGSSDNSYTSTPDNQHKASKIPSQTTTLHPPMETELPLQALHQKAPNKINASDTSTQTNKILAPIFAPKLITTQFLPPLHLSKNSTPHLNMKSAQVFEPLSPPKETTKQKQQNLAPKSLPKGNQNKKQQKTLPNTMAHDAPTTNHNTPKHKIVTPLQQHTIKRTSYSLNDKLIKNPPHRNIKPVVRLYDFAKTKKKAMTPAANKPADYNEPMDTNPCPSNNKNSSGTSVTQRKSLNTLSNASPNTQPTQSSIHPQNINLTQQASSVHSLKAPHIFLSKVTEIIPVLNIIKNSPGIGKFSTRTSKDGVIKIQSCNITTYNTIRAVLNENHIHNHTHQTPSERGYRIIIRYLHHSTPRDWIGEQLQKLGYTTRYINVIKHRHTGKPLNLFEIELEPRLDGDYDKILTLTKLGHQQITIEKQIRRLDPVQCHRCQAFGHSRNYCSRPYTCLKCAGPHDTTVCAKTRISNPKCANCGAPHVASYKGCIAYKNARYKLSTNPLRAPQADQRTVNNPTTRNRPFLQPNNQQPDARGNNTFTSDRSIHPINLNQAQPRHYSPHPLNQTHYINSNLTYSQAVRCNETASMRQQGPPLSKQSTRVNTSSQATKTSPRYLDVRHPTSSIYRQHYGEMQTQPYEWPQGQLGDQQQSHSECRLSRILESNLQTTNEMSKKIDSLLNILYSLLYPSSQQNTRTKENNNYLNIANDLTHE